MKGFILMKFSEFQPINEAPRINTPSQTPAPQVPPTKDEIERGLNQVPDGITGSTMSQAAKDRVDRRDAKNNAQDDAALGKGAKFIGQTAPSSQAKMAHSFPTQQAKQDAALSPAEFKAQQNARMTAKTGIAQPEISGSDGVNSFIDPSVIRDTQIAAKNDARPSVINSKYNANSKFPSKPKQKYK